jgi:flavin reductase (DIM6/NTAB) family NADH-FMN oxidoreductase RutF/DNA-binding IclR family transcriptional regulator
MNAEEFRQVLGQYPTGVVVVTAMGPTGEALGMTVGSFTSVSLEPPLVAFLPSKTSQSWKALSESGDNFCVNVLSAHQEDVCRAITTRKEDKFAGIRWRSSPRGNPVIDGAVAYIDCTCERTHDAGDHVIVVGKVLDLAVENASFPLLFFRGGYGSFTHQSLAAGDADLLLHLQHIDRARKHMEELAADFGTEVIAVVLVNDELVLAAAAGDSKNPMSPTRVGQRYSFVAPAGALYAAWGDRGVVDHWLNSPTETASADQVKEFREMLDRVRKRGYAVAFGNDSIDRVEAIATRFRDGDHSVTAEILREAISEAAACYNPELPDGQNSFELRWVSAPVFGPEGEVAFTIRMWCPFETVDQSLLTEYTEKLLATARAATTAIGGVEPS